MAATIWQNQFPRKLAEYLPTEVLPDLLLIVSDIQTQLSYAEGTAARVAIQRAYGSAQSVMLGTAAASWVLAAMGVLLWKNVDVKTIQQVEGRVA